MTAVCFVKPLPRRAPSRCRCVASASASTAAERYAALFARGAAGGCPPLFLAPMEGLADRPFRRALAATTGGFDEACTEFIRIPGCLPDTHAQLLKAAAKLTSGAYDARELGDTPLAAQLMGSIPDFLGEAARHLAGKLGAHRVDLNCGCPANTVTGRGAGSSLLREPAHLGECVAAMTAAVAGTGAVVTVKLRAGFDDSSLFDTNLKAALDAGAAFVTLHPRTRAQGYSGAADWDLIRHAKQRAGGIPVVGNGDVTSVARALALLKHARCDAVMIGRGAATDPLIYRRIRAAFGDEPMPHVSKEPALIEAFLRRYYAELADTPPPKSCHGERTPAETTRFRIGKLKQLSNYLLRGTAAMAAPLAELLRRGGYADASETPNKLSLALSDAMLEDIISVVRTHWAGAPRDVLIDNFSSRSGYAGATQRVMPLAGAADEPTDEAEQPPTTTKSDTELLARALAQRRRKLDDRAAWQQRKARAAVRTAQN